MNYDVEMQISHFMLYKITKNNVSRPTIGFINKCNHKTTLHDLGVSKQGIVCNDLFVQLTYTQCALIFKYYFLRKAHSNEQTPFTAVFPSATHFSAESTEAMWIKCLT